MDLFILSLLFICQISPVFALTFDVTKSYELHSVLLDDDEASVDLVPEAGVSANPVATVTDSPDASSISSTNSLFSRDPSIGLDNKKIGFWTKLGNWFDQKIMKPSQSFFNKVSENVENSRHLLTEKIKLNTNNIKTFWTNQNPYVKAKEIYIDTRNNLIESLPQYQDLNDQEKELVKKYTIKDIFDIRNAKRNAEIKAFTLFPDSLHNGKGDAFRHAYASALLTKKIGKTKAKEFTDAHEYGSNSPQEEMSMDLANNQIGIEIADKYFFNKQIEKALLNKIKTNELVIIDEEE